MNEYLYSPFLKSTAISSNSVGYTNPLKPAAPQQNYGFNPKFIIKEPANDVFIKTQQVSTRVTEGEISALYDKIFDKYKDELSNAYGGIEIIKPKLIFVDEECCPAHSFADNTITFSRQELSSEFENDFVVDNKDGYEVAYAYTIVDPETAEKLKNNPNCSFATKSEKMAILASTLRHELEHAAQIQCSLCVDGTLDNFIFHVGIDEAGISKEDMEDTEIREMVKEEFIKSVYPFIYSYQPKTKVDENSNISHLTEFKSDFNDFKRDFLTSSTPKGSASKYYSNINEILARRAESEFWQQDAKQMFPDISDEFIENQNRAVNFNMYNGALFRKKSQTD